MESAAEASQLAPQALPVAGSCQGPSCRCLWSERGAPRHTSGGSADWTWRERTGGGASAGAGLPSPPLSATLCVKSGPARPAAGERGEDSGKSQEKGEKLAGQEPPVLLPNFRLRPEGLQAVPPSLHTLATGPTPQKAAGGSVERALRRKRYLLTARPLPPPAPSCPLPTSGTPPPGQRAITFWLLPPKEQLSLTLRQHPRGRLCGQLQVCCPKQPHRVEPPRKHFQQNLGQRRWPSMGQVAALLSAPQNHQK